ncbi:MAG: TonB C-terminal domain-containing protein [Proteobacteria bacterium]|nr:TonB C-terminal domain-containing protein [Pseudomonadota bacterium]
MPRIILVTLFFLAAVGPALAGPQERANVLFVEAVKLIKASEEEQHPEKRLEHLKQAQANLQRIVEEYSSTNLAVQLISGQKIGEISVERVRVLVERAERKALERRASRAAKPVEELLSRLAASKRIEVGDPLAVSIKTDLKQLSKKYASTSYLRNLRARFAHQLSTSHETWAQTAATPVEELLFKLAASKTADEGEPLAASIEKGLKQLSKKYASTSYLQNLRYRFFETWAKTAARPVEQLLSKLAGSKTTEESAPLSESIEKALNQLSGKFASTAYLRNLRARFERQVSELAFINLADSIRRQVEENWSLPAGTREARELVVDIHIVLLPDGTVRAAEIVDTARLDQPGEEFFRSMAESAVRAVRRSSPFRDLPPEKYDQWREITFRFRPP